MTKKLFLSLILAIIMANLTACVPKQVSKLEMFPAIYEENPLSILILPPMNESTAADAKEYYSTTIQEPLGFMGYYTFPYVVTSEILKMEGIYDTELLSDMPLGKFREYFGADAVLFTTIRTWDLNYMVIASNLTVSIDCELKSTKTNEVLWKYNGTVIVDLSGQNSGGGLAGLVASAIATAVNSALTDYVPHARRANYMALSSLPYGKHHPQYLQDKNVMIIEQPPENHDQTITPQHFTVLDGVKCATDSAPCNRFVQLFKAAPGEQSIQYKDAWQIMSHYRVESHLTIRVPFVKWLSFLLLSPIGTSP